MTFRNNIIYSEDLKNIDEICLNWPALRHSKILITGGTGCIGIYLTDTLLHLDRSRNLNLEITLLSRDRKKCRSIFEKDMDDGRLRFVAHDISRPLPQGMGSFDFIIHLASNTHPKQYASEPVQTITTNFLGTFNLLNHAKVHPNCRYVCISSVEIYGDNSNPTSLRFSEKDMGYLDCAKARSGYNEAKRLCESLCASYKQQYGLDYVTVRLCRCYGPTLRADDTKAMSQFLFSAANGRNIVLKSAGNQYYSYLYASDAASAVLSAMLNGVSGQVYNAADEKSDIPSRGLSGANRRKSGCQSHHRCAGCK